MQSSEFVEEMFRTYYENSTVTAPSHIKKREFGFFLPMKGMLRHKRFLDVEELKVFLKSFAPLDAYYSCAYYDDPEAEMDKKGWLGADLIFDIDADHIPAPCDKVHDEWTCGNCGFTGRGVTPKKCPVCSSEKFDERTWPCEVCLNSAKAETIKILDMLMEDFGLSKSEVRVFFSGHRGYHVHVESEVVKTLDSFARKEIVDYVSGLGFDALFHGLRERGMRLAYISRSLGLNGFGWRGRFARGMYNFVLNAKHEDYESIGLKKNIIEALIKNRDVILKSWKDVEPWSAVKGVGFKTWQRMAEFCTKFESAKVDTVVTTDIHRLIRLAGSLHGKTGLKKVEFPLSDVEYFDPFKNAVAFKKGTVTLFVIDAPEFRLGDEIFKAYKNQKVELPTAAAVLLICKGRAEVVDQNVQ